MRTVGLTRLPRQSCSNSAVGRRRSVQLSGENARRTTPTARLLGEHDLAERSRGSRVIDVEADEDADLGSAAVPVGEEEVTRARWVRDRDGDGSAGVGGPGGCVERDRVPGVDRMLQAPVHQPRGVEVPPAAAILAPDDLTGARPAVEASRTEELEERLPVVLGERCQLGEVHQQVDVGAAGDATAGDTATGAVETAAADVLAALGREHGRIGRIGARRHE